MENQILDDELRSEEELPAFQEDEKPLVAASRRKRFYAYLIDIIPITAIVSVFIPHFWTAFNHYTEMGRIPQVRAEFLTVRNQLRLISFILWLIYSTIMDASSFYGSFGKYLVGIKVVDEFGERLTIQRSLMRNSTKVISQFALYIGFIWILFDKKRQGWHDKIAKTLVVEDENVLY